MRSFRDLSINAKLNLSALVAGGTALLLASAVLIFNDANLIRSSKVQQLSALAKVLGANSTAALTFDDPAAAKELLKSLEVQPTIRYACVFNAKGRVFATYRSKEEARISRLRAPAKAGYEFVARRIPGRHAGDSLATENASATVYLHSSMTDLHDQLDPQRHNRCSRHARCHCCRVLPLVAAAADRFPADPRIGAASPRQFRATATIRPEWKNSPTTNWERFMTNSTPCWTKFSEIERELQQAHDQLEARVQERTRELSHANLQLSNEIGEREAGRNRTGGRPPATPGGGTQGRHGRGGHGRAAQRRQRVEQHQRLGHLGRRSPAKLETLRTYARTGTHEPTPADLGTYLTQDERGKRIPGFLRLVATHLNRDQAAIVDELSSLTKNVDHVKTIVAMQQSYAGAAGVVESVSLAELVDDALRLNAASFDKYHIEVVRDYADIPEVRIEKQKLLQILMNLMTNAKDSLLESASEDRRLTVRIRVDASIRINRGS